MQLNRHAALRSICHVYWIFPDSVVGRPPSLFCLGEWLTVIKLYLIVNNKCIPAKRIFMPYTVYECPKKGQFCYVHGGRYERYF